MTLTNQQIVLWVGIWLMCVTGNFIYEMLHQRRWSVLVDRSYYQAVALFTAWVTFWMQGHK